MTKLKKYVNGHMVISLQERVSNLSPRDPREEGWQKLISLKKEWRVKRVTSLNIHISLTGAYLEGLQS